MIYGYIRVSSKDQNEVRQLIAMHEYGVDDKNIIIDKQSGKDFDRPGYHKLIKSLHKQDILVIKSIDRLGRNYDEILEQWRILTKKKEANIVVLDMPLLNTANSKDLTGTLISDIVLQLLSYVAQTEREFIKQRQREGIKAAKDRGVKFGRRGIEIPMEFESIYKKWLKKEYSGRKAAEILGVSNHTFKKWTLREKAHFDAQSGE